MSNKLGRPVTETEKRDQFIRLRFTKTEIEAIKLEAESLSISYSSYLRSKALNGKKHTLNGKALITSLDALGTELGRSGNNINQLAKHANILNKTGKLDESIINRFNILFADYIKSQQEMEVVIRKIIREARG